MGGRSVIVVGAGTAGMPCAIAAAEAGARVVVLEKAGEVGGTLHLSAGQMSAAGSRLQRSRGIEDSPDEHFADVIRIGHGRNDPAIVRLAVDEAPRTIDWLEELGYPFPADMPVVYHGHEPYSKPRTYWGPEMGISILKVVQPRLEQLVDAGRIDLRLRHRLVELLVEDATVVGVRADGPDGEVQLRADATVLATGGYTGDAALFRRFHPDVHCLLGGRDTSTGDGLVAALAVGAAARGFEHHLPSTGAVETAPGSGRVDFWEAWVAMVPEHRKAREIHVNARGERFMDEDDPSADARERQLARQGGVVWVVFDEAAILDDDPLVIGWSSEMLRDRAARGASVWQAGEIRELARLAGIDPDGLSSTVETFNAAARGERPDPFGRASIPAPLATPPFYALRTDAATVVSFGGVRVDDALRVTDAAGTPIPGLYAVGEVIGGAATMGDAYCGGMCVTPALGLGRQLGGRLARQVAP